MKVGSLRGQHFVVEQAPVAVRPRTAPVSDARVELASVQMVRALAAAMVTVWHIGWVARAFPNALPAVPSFLGFGYAGVDLFFVISGFIICHITADRPFALRRFAQRRLFRIVPLYALFTGLALVAVLLNPAWDGSGQQGLGYVVRSLLVIPMSETPYLGVGWSLEHEFIFYAIAGGLLAAGRGALLPATLTALFAAGVALHVVGSKGTEVWDYHLFSLYHFEFLVGVLIFRWRVRMAALLGWVGPVVIGVVGFLVISHIVAIHSPRGAEGLQVSTLPAGWMGLVRVVGFGLCSGLLLQGLLEAERCGALTPHGPLTRSLWRVLVAVGAASYVLYLGHWFVYSVLSKLYVAASVPAVLALPALLAAAFATVVFALVCHRWVERPLLAAMRQRF